ncbi:MAG: hypothetical protein H7175_04595, partial [Burkholderiales bacterium]|nr:hypothetical protein [Anaerolineae bacterium]
LLDEKGTRRAAEQGIHAEHITGFLTRVTGMDKLPQLILDILGNARSGPTGNVTVENVLVLRTTAPETLDFMLDTPALRRFLGARLGPMAVVARRDNIDALIEALTERGIEVEVVE